MNPAALGVAMALAVAAGQTPSPSDAPLPLRPRTHAPALARLAPGSLASGARSRGTGPLSPAEQRRRDAIVEQLIEVEALASEQPETAEPALRDALAEFADAAPLVGDASAQSARIYALLALARTLLVSHQDTAAGVVLDEAIAVAGDDPLPVTQFGPSIERLHRARLDAAGALAPGSITVECAVPCRVWIDERAAEAGTTEVGPGQHRVWVEAEVPGRSVVRDVIELDPATAIVLAYDVENEGDRQVDALTTSAPPPSPAEPPRRIAPRWATIAGMAMGVAVAGAGGALVGVDHRCPDLSDPRTNPCARILNTDRAGWTGIAVGGALAITAAIILSIDEVRRRRARRRGPTTQTPR